MASENADKNLIKENEFSLSSGSEGLITCDDAMDFLNNIYLKEIINKSEPIPELLVARALLNEFDLFGYIAKYDESAGKITPMGYTLEPTRNIPEKGYIPPGIYDFKKWDSTKLGKTLRLFAVPNFTNVLVHVGNIKDDTTGCILAAKKVDNPKSPKRLVDSRTMTDYLYDNFPSGQIDVYWM